MRNFILGITVTLLVIGLFGLAEATLGLVPNQCGCDSPSTRTPCRHARVGRFHGAARTASKQPHFPDRREFDRRYEGLHHELFHVSRDARQLA